MKMCPDIYTRVGIQHITTSGDTADYSESGRDTAHEIVFRCSYWGGDPAQNSKIEGGGTPHKASDMSVLRVDGWVSGWVVGGLSGQ